MFSTLYIDNLKNATLMIRYAKDKAVFIPAKAIGFSLHRYFEIFNIPKEFTLNFLNAPDTRRFVALGLMKVKYSNGKNAITPTIPKSKNTVQSSKN